MKASSDTGTLQWLLRGIFTSCGHESGHLILSKLDFAAAESSQADISNLELGGRSRHCWCFVDVVVGLKAFARGMEVVYGVQKRVMWRWEERK
jgi:hypothetical protein